jgi:UDP-GlcNAc:undecaprenyl-phosphate GlcNAc-1-phosphate transferase
MFGENEWILYIAAFACAFGISLVATPYVKKLAFKAGAIKYPRERDMHTEPMPEMGGLAIILGFMATTCVMAFFVEELRSKTFAGFMAGAVIIAITGVLDDIYSLKARTKLIMQIIAAAVVILTGARIEIVVWPITAYLEKLSIPITFLWIIGMTNAINLIDGLDGLAAGVSAIGALCLMVLCSLSDHTLAVILSAMLAGSCLGFLPRNFNPSEIFMGDTGALFLGYVLAVSSITGVFKGYTLLAVLVVFLALALPIIDTLFAFFRRLRKGESFMKADKSHLHHRLIDAGYSHRNAVMILYGLSIVTAVIAIVIAVQDIRAIVVTVLFMLVLLCVLFVYRKRTVKPPKDDK